MNRQKRRSASILSSLLTVGLCLLPGSLSFAQPQAERLVLAFYYAWYDQNTWKSGRVPDLPLSPYTSAHRETMARHVGQAKQAGIDAFILNWWGKNNPTNKNLATLLDVAAEQGFHVAVDFDLNSPFMSGPAAYADHLRYLHTVHAAHKAYLRVQNRPVIFFYNVSRLSVSAWQALREEVDPHHNAWWIAEGTDLKYLSVFDGHHLYSIIWPNGMAPAHILPSWGKRVQTYNQQHGTNKLWIATVMPGYDDRKARPAHGFARPRQDGEFYRQCWQAAIASRPHWVVINSFNEWLEGSYIEPSQAYGTLYLELTREWTAQFKKGSSAPPALSSRSSPRLRPSPTPTPSPTPDLPDLICPWPEIRSSVGSLPGQCLCRRFENPPRARAWLTCRFLDFPSWLSVPIAY